MVSLGHEGPLVASAEQMTASHKEFRGHYLNVERSLDHISYGNKMTRNMQESCRKHRMNRIDRNILIANILKAHICHFGLQMFVQFGTHTRNRMKGYDALLPPRAQWPKLT